MTFPKRAHDPDLPPPLHDIYFRLTTVYVKLNRPYDLDHQFSSAIDGAKRIMVELLFPGALRGAVLCDTSGNEILIISMQEAASGLKQ